MSDLQKRVLLRQTEDIRLFNKTNNWFLVRLHRSQTVALLNSVARLFFRLLLLSAAWPWAVITQSEYTFRHPAYFAVVYVGLFVTSVLYLICKPSVLLSIGSWLSCPRVFHSSQIHVFCSMEKIAQLDRSCAQHLHPSNLLVVREWG